MDDREIIEWAKEKYPQYLENIELLRSLYKRQVLKESIFVGWRRKIPFRRLVDIKEGEKGKVKAIIVEIRKTGVKNKKWASVIVGDNSGMKPLMIFQDVGDEDVKEGEEYILIVGNRGEKGLSGEILKKIESRDESLALDAIFEYIYELNGGRVQKDRLMTFISKRGLNYDEIVDLFSLEDEGDVVVGA